MIEAPLALYRYRRDGLSADDRTFLPQVLRVLDKAYGPDGVLHGMHGRNRARAYHYLACSWMAAERGDLGTACRLFTTSLFLWPWRVGKHGEARWARLKLLVFFARNATGRTGPASATAATRIPGSHP